MKYWLIMAQAQIDQHLAVCNTHTLKRDSRYHIPLDNLQSVTIRKRQTGITIGLYKIDGKGKRRGTVVPLSIWEKLQESADLIDLAVQLMTGTVVNAEDI